VRSDILGDFTAQTTVRAFRGERLTSARAIHRANFAETRTSVPFRIEVASSLEDFSAQWPTTADRGDARCYPFQCADILQVWCDTIGRANHVEPVFARIVSPEGDPLFLLPLGIEKSSGTRVLRFLDGGVSDYNAPVVYPRAASARLGTK
jgi:CelD/BcsL family acetyltransferase involved in cellulose biosynthesis